MVINAQKSVISQAAIASQWINANAGSGKTTVLTRRLVSLLLLGVPPERICCITYTKAAAGEMRSRMMKALRALLLADEAALDAQIRNDYGLVPTAEIRTRARLLLGTVLDSPTGGVALTTIHGFCQQILRAFPLEAQVPPHFTVADDAQTAQLHSQVKHRLLSSDRHDPLVAHALALLAERSGEMRFDALLKAVLAIDYDRSQPLSQQRARLFAALNVAPNDNEETIAAHALACLDASQQSLLREALPPWLADTTAYKRTLGESCSAWLCGTLTFDAWVNLWLTEKWSPRSLLVKADFGPALNAIVAHCMAVAEHAVAQRAALALAEESAAALVLSHQLHALLEQVKRERSVLDYDDLITSTASLLTLRDMVGWVMSKLDHRIDHMLIDEAQDTSADQWHIAHALVDELVANVDAQGSAGVPRSLLVVGDEKQSIFSFQGAAPQLYAQKKQVFSQLLAHAGSGLQSQELRISYRSAPAILQVVDAVAHDPAIAAALSSAGSPPVHVAKRDTACGEVVLHPLLAAQAREVPVPFHVPCEYLITRSNAQILAEHVAQTVADWMAHGTWNAGDILILTRNRKPIMLPLLRALQRRNVPVAGIDRLVLAEHLAVKDILALMRWCASTQDDLALAQVLRSPLIGWTDAQLHMAAMDRAPASLFSRVRDALPQLQAWRDASSRRPYDFLTYVLEVCATRQHFARRFGEEIHEILDELKEQAAAMPASMAPTIANFTAWIRGSDRQIKREMDTGAHDHVRVMTVHGAKGLEAPLVLLVDTVSMPSLQKEMLSPMRDAQGQVYPLLALSGPAKRADAWLRARTQQADAQMAEHYRLLYVAMTRARDALHVFGMQPATGDLADTCWYATIRRGMQRLHPVTREDGALRVADAGVRAANTATTPSSPLPDIPLWVQEKTPALRPRAAASISPSHAVQEALAPLQPAQETVARTRGVRLHRVMQCLHAHSTPDQLAQLIAHIAPDWSEPARSDAVEELWAMYSAHRWLWQYPGRAEVTISGHVSIDGVDYPVLGQIDRLLEHEGDIIVIDYKTGRDVPLSSAQVGDGYVLQMKFYTALLETLYPGRRIRPAVLWTAQAQLMWLDAVVAATPWARATVPQTP